MPIDVIPISFQCTVQNFQTFSAIAIT